MGENVEFPSNGNTAGGYLAPAKEGAQPGIVVLQEWWGVDSYIKGVCDELSNEGFTALVPDLYHGELAKHTEMDKAAELLATRRLTVREVAHRVGYRQPAQFAKAFRRHHDVSPSAYRSRARFEPVVAVPAREAA